MHYADDRQDQGASFLVGLLAGTVVGAGLGLLFAPKPGSDLRQQLADQANTLRHQASEGYQRAADTADDLAGRGRAAMGRMEDTASRVSG
jgi:gas vesicle protein